MTGWGVGPYHPPAHIHPEVLVKINELIDEINDINQRLSFLEKLYAENYHKQRNPRKRYR